MSRFKWTRVDVNAPSDRADFIRQWILKLFDPAIKQGKYVLKTTDNKYCCIGVGSELAKLEQKIISGEVRFIDPYVKGYDIHHFTSTVKIFLNCEPTMKVLNFFGENKKYEEIGIKAVNYLNGSTCLAAANDSGRTFFKIANAIRLFSRAFFRNLTSEEECYILATDSPQWKDYRHAQSKARKTDGKGQSGTQEPPT